MMSYGTCRLNSTIPSPFVLIQDEQGVWLCQNHGSSANNNNNDNINDQQPQLYTRSIQVLGYTKFLQLKSTDPPLESSKLYCAETNSVGTIIACLQQSPVPILSLSILLQKEEDGDTRQDTPLFLACIKRQWIGCPVVWNNNNNNNSSSSSSSNIRTVLTVSVPHNEDNTDRIYSGHVQSVQTMQSAAQENQTMTLGMIYPSTRITVNFIESPPPPPPPPPTTTTTTTTPSPTTITSSSAAEQLLRETLQCLNQNIPRFFLWAGPPGVGKTYSVQKVLPWCHYLQNLTATNLASLHPIPPHTNDKPTLIFLDECDAWASLEEGAATLAYWLDEWSLSHPLMVVVAATNRIDDLPASLRRRFHREMHFMPPTAVERSRILQQLLQEWWSNITTGDVQEVADLCVGYVAADLAALVRQASLAQMLAEDKTMTPKDYLLRAMQQVGASALRDAAMTAPLTTTSWEDIAGDAGGAKKALRQAIEWPRTKQKAYQLLGLTPPRGILLHGPPGCAKTSLARAAAGAAGVAFVSLAPADVYASSYVGDAEAIVRRSFDLARSAAPCVLFFDEIDAILGVMSDSSGHAGGLARGHSAEARVLSTFLNEMDGVDGSWKDGVLVLGATNRPWTLDAALLRPGRFDKIIYVPPPDREGRRSILEMQTRQWRKNSHDGGIDNDDPIDIDYLASEDISRNMTGAEIKGACQEAAMNALREYSEGGRSVAAVCQKDLLQAFSSIQPLLSDPKQMESFCLFENERRNCS